MRASRILVALLAAGVLLCLGATVWASTYTVCSNGCDFTSIQEAVDAAYSGDTVELAAETFFEPVVVTPSITIRGAGPEKTIVDGAGAPPGAAAVFKALLDSSGNRSCELSLEDLTIQNGPAGVVLETLPSESCLPYVTITRALIRGNEGAGFDGTSLLKVTNSTIANNGGAGIRNAGPVLVRQSSVSGNGGVGIDVVEGPIVLGDNSVDVLQSTISENEVGLRSRILTQIKSSTITGNRSDGYQDLVWGCLWPPVTFIRNTTIAGNGGNGVRKVFTSGDCGPVDPQSYPGEVWLMGTIVANSAHHDCGADYGTIVRSVGYSLASDDTCGLLGPTSLPDTDPLLLPLDDNGGPTLTHALHPESPAIDRIDTDNAYYECPPSDQRGVVCPQDGDGDGNAVCDIGAFEYVLPDPMDLLDSLADQILALGLASGIENGLLAKVNAASMILSDLEEANDHAASSMLGAFIHQVQAQHGKKIEAVDADSLIAAAEEIIDLL